jgi:hypothetical protein
MGEVLTNERKQRRVTVLFEPTLHEVRAALARCGTSVIRTTVATRWAYKTRSSPAAVR